MPVLRSKITRPMWRPLWLTDGRTPPSHLEEAQEGLYVPRRGPGPSLTSVLGEGPAMPRWVRCDTVGDGEDWGRKSGRCRTFPPPGGYTVGLGRALRVWAALRQGAASPTVPPGGGFELSSEEGM